MSRKRLQRVNVTDGLHKLLKKHQGLHSFDDTKPHYVTYPELVDYWTRKRIQLAFKDCRARYDDAPFLAPISIRPFLRLFTLLVWIDRLETLDHSFMQCGLTDQKFPLHEFPAAWERTTERLELFELVRDEQWKFFPFMFEQSRLFNENLSPRYILPINHVENLQTSLETVVDLIFVDPLCVVDLGGEEPEPVRLVRKQYLGEEHEAAFLREHRAYEALHNPKYRSKHFVDCYGYFSQTQSDGAKAYNLILEYADGGSLAQFYLGQRRPRTPSELIGFWRSFAGVLEGLHVANQASKHANTDDESLEIVHQDIKPSNLLISRKASGTLFDFIIKLADFGYSSTHLRGHGDEETEGVEDSCGGQTYSAPENSHHERCTQNEMNVITAMVDIWSFGCVLSETCVWLYYGPEGQQQYEMRRTQEIDANDRLRRAGHHGCFHNGIEVLKEVRQTHQQIIASLPEYDHITAKVIGMIENSMLQADPNHRHTPYRLFERMQSLIDEAKASVIGPRLEETSRRSSAPETAKNQMRSPKQAERKRRPRLTYREACDFVENRLARDPRTKETIEFLKAALEKRDVIFYIENSESMREHYDHIRQALRTYAYITKLIDDDGIEVVYASRPRKLRRYTNTTRLLQDFDKQEWKQSTYEAKLSDFIGNRIMKRLPAWWKISYLRPKSLSIFYFTDGIWGERDGTACGVENPIQKLIDKMVRKDIDRTEVSVQLVRFGDDESGKRRLRILDDLGKESKMDVVDTKPYNYDVYATLIGSLRQDLDAECEDHSTTEEDSWDESG